MRSTELNLRSMRPDEWDRVAELICHSTNRWYQAGNKPAIFPHGPASCRLFCEVYEDLDPGCCVVAEDTAGGELLGSCFYHPRETHVSLGIMNAHPDAFNRGVAGKLLRYIIDVAERAGKPVRLVSSAMNLDSFSLYNRNGFVPRKLFQDMYVPSPDRLPATVPGFERVRQATLADVPAIVALEEQLAHIRREKDYRYFIENRRGVWHTSVYESPSGGIDGYLVSVAHPGSNMLGPGAMRTEQQAAALILNELRQRAGATPVLLAPVEAVSLVNLLYAWGARNCEIHFAQVRGEYEASSGVVMPTFMPETA
jgi:GNAT superfamily N-acetyltransferase